MLTTTFAMQETPRRAAIEFRRFSSDVLVIGGGLAGMRAAVAATESGARVSLLSKGPPGLGVVAFNAPVPDAGDSPPRFFADMLAAGEFLNDPHLAARVAYGALDQLAFLERLGMKFRHSEGGYAPRLTAGHSLPRTVYTSDRTGPDVIGYLQRWLRARAVPMLRHRYAVGLIQGADGVAAAVVLDTDTYALEVHTARAIVLATGGLGRLYATSTNPGDLAGDGYALAFRAGAVLLDLEFVQFEPFVVLAPAKSRGFTVSFLLADEPRIYNALGEPFLLNNGKGFGKDVLARAVFEQVRTGKGTPAGGVYFDLRHVAPEQLELHARFMAVCRSGGLDPRRDPIEVGAAQHYLMGGVQIDDQGATAVPGLFAAGEVTGGVHGANRLSGNSGTETLVFGACAGQAAARCAAERVAPTVSDAVVRTATPMELTTLGSESVEGRLGQVRRRLARIMWDHVGLVREEAELRSARAALGALADETAGLRGNTPMEGAHLLEARNQLLLAELICDAAVRRRESRGSHFRSDFPCRDDVRWLLSTGFRLGPGGETVVVTVKLGSDWRSADTMERDRPVSGRMGASGPGP